VEPRAALERIEREGGGLSDTLWLVVLGAVTFRAGRLIEALLALADPSVGGAIAGPLGVLWSEVVLAAWVVIPAAVIVTAAAGVRRDASLDLELGAACYVPFFVVRGLARAADALAGRELLPPLASEIPAAAVALLVMAHAIRLARSRSLSAPAAPLPSPAPAPPPAAEAPPAVEAPAPAAARGPGRRALAAGLGVLALALVGLAGNAVWASRHPDVLRPVRQGEPAPVFELPRLDGAGTLSPAQMRGRVVVLDFWASWCGPCRAIMPMLDQLQQEWAPRGVSFIGVNSDGDGATPDELRAFVHDHPVSYPSVLDDGTANALYKIRWLPSVIVIGRDGSVRRSFLGRVGRDGLAEAIRDAVAERAP
jgi:thiol-disulfide isomerase/thioredoxin